MKNNWSNNRIVWAVALVSACSTRQPSPVLETNAPVPGLSTLVRPASVMVQSQVQTLFPQMRKLGMEKHFTGTIRWDERGLTTVSARSGGRIERLYVHYNLQPVVRGQKILDIYSPELAAAQREYAYLFRSEGDNAATADVRARLLRLGLSPQQITALESTGTPSYRVEITAPFDGMVLDLASALEERPTMLSGEQEPLSIREGSYLAAGGPVLRMIQSSRKRAVLDAPQQDGGAIHRGDTIVLHAGGRDIQSVVESTEPLVKEGEPFVRIRCAMPVGELAVGQLVEATWQRWSAERLTIPLTSRVDLGDVKVAFVKRKGVFRPVAIGNGMQNEHYIEIMEGLDASDSVAVTAAYLVDGESFVKPINRTR